MLPSTIPEYHRKAAMKQWRTVGAKYYWQAIRTLWNGLEVAYRAEFMDHPIPTHEILAMHSDKYKAIGSSGAWEYQSVKSERLKPWANYEDGSLGEPSGKWSATREGKEHSFLSKYRWALRNPFNTGKRTSDFYACFINECDIYWIDSNDPSTIKKDGDEPILLSDKYGQLGWEFVWAVHRDTGKHYYGYREVRAVGDQTRRGFKIKSAHSEQDKNGLRILQGPSDLDKAFTWR